MLCRSTQMAMPDINCLAPGQGQRSSLAGARTAASQPINFTDHVVSEQRPSSAPEAPIPLRVPSQGEQPPNPSLCSAFLFLRSSVRAFTEGQTQRSVQRLEHFPALRSPDTGSVCWCITRNLYLPAGPGCYSSVCEFKPVIKKGK